MWPKRRRRSAKEQIEKIPKIATHEMAWFKSKRKRKLRPSTAYRSPRKVEFSPPKPDDKSLLHTHPYGKIVLPSGSDIYRWARTASEIGIDAFHIASINKHGKVTGYFHCRFTRHFIDSMKDRKKMEEFDQRLSAYRVINPRKIEEFLQFMAKKNYLKYHLKPMPGYKYENGKFVKSEVR